MIRMPRIDSKYAANIAGYVLLSGAVTTAIYRISGFQCPMRSIGLACPGCGCGRASIDLLKHGPLVAFQNQPTALLFLLSIVVLAFTGRWAWTIQKKWASSLVVMLPIHLAFANLVLQLIRAGAS